MAHELEAFMATAATTLADEYERIRKRVREDPGNAGDEGEENWAELLRGWLPPTFPVVTRGRLLSADGRASSQLDVIVLDSCYPRALLNKKVYLAGSVVAAFECKLTLRRSHLVKAVRTAKELVDFSVARAGTPYDELHRRIVYGVLAHSEALGKGNRWEIIADRLEDSVAHPRDLVDVVCVANSASYIRETSIHIGPDPDPESCEFPDDVTRSRGVVTGMYEHGGDDFGQRTGGAIAPFMYFLLRRLASERQELQDLASYFTDANIAGVGVARTIEWGKDVFSSAVIERLESEGASVVPWSKWSKHQG